MTEEAEAMKDEIAEVNDASTTVAPTLPGSVPDELHGKLTDALADLSEARADYENAKEAAKAAKTRFDDANNWLATVAQKVSDALDGKVEAAPMFDAAGQVTSEAKADDNGTLKPEVANESIGVLGLSDGIIDKLIEGRIVTLGDLQKRFKDKGEWWNADIAGIGPETAAKVQDAYNAFVFPDAPKN